MIDKKDQCYDKINKNIVNIYEDYNCRGDTFKVMWMFSTKVRF